MTTNRRALAALLADARTEDAAWHELVARFTPEVSAAISSHGLTPTGEELAARATWAGLARRLHLPTGPDDVEQWLVTRAHIECQRVVHRRPGSDAAALIRRRQVGRRDSGLHDRRQSRDRRHQPRGSADRRTGAGDRRLR